MNSTWLITSDLANQRARKVLLTYVDLMFLKQIFAREAKRPEIYINGTINLMLRVYEISIVLVFLKYPKVNA